MNLSMRTGLRIIGVILAILTVSVWLATGAHMGWTQTQVTVMKLDPITEIEYPETRDKFVAGVGVLGAGLSAALALFGASFFFKRNQPETERTKAT